MRYGYWLVAVLSVSGLALAGCGDDDTGGGETATTASTSTGAGGGGASVNGCSAATAQSASTIEVVGAALAYTPSCIKVAAGTSVTFKADFVSHPLRGGEVDGVPTPDSSSPITATDTGMSASFMMADPGTYGFYCNFHFASMKGAIIVE